MANNQTRKLVPRAKRRHIVNSTLAASGHFKRMSRTKILPMSEQLVLVQQYQMAVGRAKDELRTKLLEANWRLIYSIARRYVGRIDLDTLYQEGCVGFFVGLDRFTVSKGYSLTTFVTWWIRQKIVRALNREGFLVGIPEYAYGRVGRAIQDSPECIEGMVQDKVLAQKHGINHSMVCAFKQRSISFSGFNQDQEYTNDLSPKDNQYYYKNSTRAEDRVEDPFSVRELQWDVQRAVAGIPDKRAKRCVIKFFGLDGEPSQTLKELGRFYHVSRERIRQMIAKALATYLKDTLSTYRRL